MAPLGTENDTSESLVVHALLWGLRRIERTDVKAGPLLWIHEDPPGPSVSQQRWTGSETALRPPWITDCSQRVDDFEPLARCCELAGKGSDRICSTPSNKNEVVLLFGIIYGPPLLGQQKRLFLQADGLHSGANKHQNVSIQLF